MVKKSALPSFMNNQALRLIFFGGKGGVGKSTLACAAGVYLAENKPKKKVLIISVDPSHSLKDIFSQALGSQPT
ncbi:MAG: ArsA-related P-loop ATPase, partial [bacterium]